MEGPLLLCWLHRWPLEVVLPRGSSVCHDPGHSSPIPGLCPRSPQPTFPSLAKCPAHGETSAPLASGSPPASPSRHPQLSGLTGLGDSVCLLSCGHAQVFLGSALLLSSQHPPALRSCSCLSRPPRPQPQASLEHAGALGPPGGARPGPELLQDTGSPSSGPGLASLLCTCYFVALSTGCCVCVVCCPLKV